MKNKIFQMATFIYLTVLRRLDQTRPLMMLVLRLWVANEFWVSGLQKIRNFDNAVQLFIDEYPVPFLPAYPAAVVSTAFELACPVLLAFGLASRLAALPLLVMTGVIYFTYDKSQEVIYWALALGMILSYGADKLSLDYVVYKKYQKAGV